MPVVPTITKHLCWGLFAQCGMLPLTIIVAEVTIQSLIQRVSIAVGLRIYILILECPPQAFDKYVVDSSSAPIHAQGDLFVQQHFGEGIRGELGTLICVKNLRGIG